MIQLLSFATIAIVAILSIKGLRRPGVMLALLWSTYAIEQVAQQGASFLLVRSWLMNVALAGMTLLAVFRAFLSGKTKGFSPTTAHVLIGGLFLQCILSYTWSIAPSDTYYILTKNAPYIFAFAVLAPFCALNYREVDTAIKTIVHFGAILLIVLAFSEYGKNGRGVVLQLADGRLAEANPLAAATFGGYVSICAIFYMYTKRSQPTLQKAFYSVIILLGVFVIIRSGSRGQLIALFASSLLWLPITAKVAAKRSSIIAVAIAGVIAIGSWFYVSNSGSYRWDLDTVSDSGSGRIAQTLFVIESMLEEGPSAWILGLGNSASYSLIGGYPHNVPGEVLAEEGILGFMLYLSPIHI